MHARRRMQEFCFAFLPWSTSSENMAFPPPSRREVLTTGSGSKKAVNYGIPAGVLTTTEKFYAVLCFLPGRRPKTPADFYSSGAA